MKKESAPQLYMAINSLELRQQVAGHLINPGVLLQLVSTIPVLHYRPFSQSYFP